MSNLSLIDVAWEVHDLVRSQIGSDRFHDQSQKYLARRREAMPAIEFWGMNPIGWGKPRQIPKDLLISDRELMLDEKYALLAALHDEVCTGEAKIGPRSDLDCYAVPREQALDAIRWACLRDAVRSALDGDYNTKKFGLDYRHARSWLADVRADFDQAKARVDGSVSYDVGGHQNANEMKAIVASPKDEQEAPPTAKHIEANGGHEVATKMKQPADSEDVAGNMTWQEAAERMKRLMARGDPFTSQHKLAELFGCSSSTVNKAIGETSEVQDWAKREISSTPKAQSINEVVTDNTADSRELDPADEAAVREFIEKAYPEVKAWFLALSEKRQLQVLETIEGDSEIKTWFHSLDSKNQLEFLKDPDKFPTILGRKP